MKYIKVPYLDQTANGAFTGCESVSAVMLLHYLGFPLTIEEFIGKYLDREDFERRGGVLYGPDPRDAFAGNPFDAESMGCYAPVIRRSLERVLGPDRTVRDETGSTVPSLCRRYIDKDMPVVIWATINMQNAVTGPTWKLKKSGEYFTWRSREHCLLLVGYTDEAYILNDPWQGNGIIRVPRALFEDRFRQQYRQAVAVLPAEK